MKNNKQGIILVCCHIYYKDMYFELKKYIENIKPYRFDIFFTFVKNHKDIINDIKISFPNATIKIFENNGYDIGPFIEILNFVDLNKYSYIIKIHTKRNMPFGSKLNNYYDVSGNKFRHYCLSFLESKNFNKCLNIFNKNKKVGMIGDYHLIVNEPVLCCNKSQQSKIMYLLDNIGINVAKKQFIAGSMFICRAKILKSIQRLNLKIEDFEQSVNEKKRKIIGLAHMLERIFGLVTVSEGYLIKDVYTEKYKQIFGKIMLPFRFLKRKIFLIKINSKGKLIVKLCLIPLPIGEVMHFCSSCFKKIFKIGRIVE